MNNLKIINNIAFAGSGNIAWHLIKAFQSKGFTISGIWSRTFQHAQDTAKEFSIPLCTTLKELQQNADIIIIAVSDNAIIDIASELQSYKGIVAHTAGSISLQTLAHYVKHAGVFYPLQTFSKGVSISMETVPFFVEAIQEQDKNTLYNLAKVLSNKVYEADSASRLLLHVAAVFAGNYSNLMYSIADEILNHHNLPTEALHALITETARKAITTTPANVQTGPARRNDKNTIDKHAEALASQPHLAELYLQLSKIIINKYHK